MEKTKSAFRLSTQVYTKFSSLRSIQRTLGVSMIIIFLLSSINLIVVAPSVNAAEVETVVVNVNSIQATNKLSLGFQLDGRDISAFARSSTLQDFAEEANFKMARFFHHRYGWAVTNWDNRAKTGNWGWSNYDRVVDAITGIGAEPLICLGYGGSGEMSIPTGMDRWSQDSFFPDPEQFAAYAREWVRHFSGEVKYWEILNEPYQHYYWTDQTKLARYCTFWNIVATEMKKEDPTILISHDGSTVEHALDYWVDNGEDLGFLGFHKYDSSSRNPATDAELFARAESERVTDYGGSASNWRNYGVQEAKDVWSSGRGETLPVICGEANINWAFNPTDDRIQTMTAAVWAALTIRYQSLAGLDYWLWWDFYGSGDGGRTQFSTISSSYDPCYSYYAMNMFSSNSGVGDIIVESSSSSSDVRSFAWIHGNKLNIMVIHKDTESITFNLSGVSGTFNIQQLDSQHSPPLTGTVSSGNSISLRGYSVILLQQETDISLDSSNYVVAEQSQSSEQNSDPIASISAPTQATEGTTVTFDAESSYDSDGYIRDYYWDFGDTNVDDGETVTHEYSSDGTYTVTLTVIDNKGASDLTTKEITITESESESTYSRRSSYRSYRDRYTSYRSYRRR